MGKETIMNTVVPLFFVKNALYVLSYTILLTEAAVCTYLCSAQPLREDILFNIALTHTARQLSAPTT